MDEKGWFMYANAETVRLLRAEMDAENKKDKGENGK